VVRAKGRPPDMNELRERVNALRERIAHVVARL
jgi:polyhydroxyalkanoate synthesis regulator phasin